MQSGGRVVILWREAEPRDCFAFTLLASYPVEATELKTWLIFLFPSSYFLLLFFHSSLDSSLMPGVLWAASPSPALPVLRCDSFGVCSAPHHSCHLLKLSISPSSNTTLSAGLIIGCISEEGGEMGGRDRKGWNLMELWAFSWQPLSPLDFVTPWC